MDARRPDYPSGSTSSPSSPWPGKHQAFIFVIIATLSKAETEV
jgi:hypothetical protein